MGYEIYYAAGSVLVSSALAMCLIWKVRRQASSEAFALNESFERHRLMNVALHSDARPQPQDERDLAA